jgi:putative transposase
MSLPRSTYYKVPDAKNEERRQQSEDALGRAIEHVVDDWPVYDYRRVTHELRRRGILANHKRVARLMRQRGLQAKAPRRFVATTDSAHDERIFPEPG